MNLRQKSSWKKNACAGKKRKGKKTEKAKKQSRLKLRKKKSLRKKKRSLSIIYLNWTILLLKIR